jgi:hypothetical protein
MKLNRPRMAHISHHPQKTAMKHAHIKQHLKHEPRRKSHIVADGEPFCLKPEGFSAALSEESMRPLKYCLKRLQVRPTNVIVSYPIC